MTAVKQVAITRAQHLKSLANYLDNTNERHHVAGRGSQNLVDEHNWAREMEATREAYGHNAAARKGAKNTYMYHQILAFNPSDCSMQGGKMDERACLEYAREYVRMRYPNQEAYWALHREHCKRDGTDRWAVHIGINRTDLETGRRLDEGPARKAAAARVATVRELDGRWGLRQLERGKKNTRDHERQPSQAEKRAQEGLIREAKEKGLDRPQPTQNERVRRIVAREIDEVSRLNDCKEPMRELESRLRDKGITLATSARGDLQYRWRDGNLTRRINGATLGEIRTKAGRTIRFSYGAVRQAIGITRTITRSIERVMDSGRGRRQ